MAKRKRAAGKVTGKAPRIARVLAPTDFSPGADGALGTTPFLGPHHYSRGVPRPTILKVAAKEGADLIVMGTHGRSRVSRVFFGSVAEHVVRHSRIPVLTIRER